MHRAIVKICKKRVEQLNKIVSNNDFIFQNKHVDLVIKVTGYQ